MDHLFLPGLFNTHLTTLVAFRGLPNTISGYMAVKSFVSPCHVGVLRPQPATFI